MKIQFFTFFRGLKPPVSGGFYHLIQGVSGGGLKPPVSGGFYHLIQVVLCGGVKTPFFRGFLPPDSRGFGWGGYNPLI